MLSKLFSSIRLSHSLNNHHGRAATSAPVRHMTQLTPILISEKPLLSYREMKHSLKFLSFFSHYAAPLYNCNQIQFMREFLPIVLTIQGLVYNADYEIEKGQKNPLAFRSIEPWIERKENMLLLLKSINLYTPAVEKEANNLSDYWHLENQLMLGEKITHKKLIDAIRLRASDVMMIHQICQKISGFQFDSQTWKSLQLIEVIRDIEADLRQYETDVKHQDFNIYQMFVKLYQKEARGRLQTELDMRKSEYRQLIKQLPTPFDMKFQELTRRYYEERPPIDVPEEMP